MLYLTQWISIKICPIKTQFIFKTNSVCASSYSLGSEVDLTWSGLSAGAGWPVLACNQTYLSLWHGGGTSLMKQVKKMFITKTASRDAGAERRCCQQAVTCLACCPMADAVIDLDVCPVPPVLPMSRVPPLFALLSKWILNLSSGSWLRGAWITYLLDGRRLVPTDAVTV